MKMKYLYVPMCAMSILLATTTVVTSQTVSTSTQNIIFVHFDYSTTTRLKPLLGSNDIYGGTPVMKAGHTAILSDFPSYQKVKDAAGIKIVRFPGGTISNTYDWKRAIGPITMRIPQVVGFNNLSGSSSSNFGPDEAGLFAESNGGQLIIVVPFNEGAESAADFVEYMTGTRDMDHNGVNWAAVRAINGHPNPYNVAYWEIGNESGGNNLRTWTSWPQIGDDNEQNGMSQGSPQAINWWIQGGLKVFQNQQALPLQRFSVVGTTTYAAVDWGPTGTLNYASYTGLDASNKDYQKFGVKFPPIATSAPLVVRVQTGGATIPYSEIQNWKACKTGRHCFRADRTTGQIIFGAGPFALSAASKVFVDYTSGPHTGYVDFYKQMKAVNPTIKIVTSHWALGQQMYVNTIRALGANVDGFQIHTAGESYPDTMLPGGDSLSETLGRAYFGAPEKLLKDSKNIVPRLEIVNSETGLGKGLLDQTGQNQIQTITGSVAIAAYFARLVEDFGPVAKNPVRTSLLNYTFNETAPIDNTKVTKGGTSSVTAIGQTVHLFDSYVGVKILKKFPVTNIATRDIQWQGLSNGILQTHTDKMPKLLTVGSKGLAGVFYILAINTTPTEKINVHVRADNIFSLKGNVKISSIKLTAPAATSSNPTPQIVEEIAPRDVFVSGTNTFTFPIAPLSMRAIQISP
jgi:alpha-L-arabinofuranosidase